MTRTVGPAGKYDGAAFSLNNFGYAAGGTTGSVVATVYAYCGGVRDYRVKVGLPRWAPGVGNTYWTQKAPYPIVDLSASLYAMNGYLYGHGGKNATGSSASVYVSSVYRYNDDLNSWANLGNGSSGFYFGGFFSLNGFGYSGGGRTTSDAPISSFYKFNDFSNIITVTTPWAVRLVPAGMSLNGYGYIVGGVNATPATTSEMMVFNDGLGTWTTTEIADTTCYDPGVFNLNGYGYRSGGGITTGPSTFTSTTSMYQSGSLSWLARTVCPSAAGNYNGVAFAGYGWILCPTVSGTTETSNIYQYNEIDYWVQKIGLSSPNSKYRGPFGVLNNRIYGVAGGSANATLFYSDVSQMSSGDNYARVVVSLKIED